MEIPRNWNIGIHPNLILNNNLVKYHVFIIYFAIIYSIIYSFSTEHDSETFVLCA